MVVSIPTRFAAPTMALVAGSVLAWEIVLTRLASLRYHFHFGFLAVSVGLLGMGISGAVLAATVQRWRADPCGWLRRWTAGYLSAILLGGVGLYLLPVHLGVMNSVGVGCFVAFIVLGGLPFLAGGGIIGLLLSADREVVHRRYGIDLLAAGVGCIGVLQVLESWGAGGALCVIAAAAVGAVVVQQELSGLFRGLWLLPVGLLLVSPRVDGWCPAPSKITRPM